MSVVNIRHPERPCGTPRFVIGRIHPNNTEVPSRRHQHHCPPLSNTDQPSSTPTAARPKYTHKPRNFIIRQPSQSFEAALIMDALTAVRRGKRF